MIYVASYGNTEIEALSVHYGTPKETGGVELEPLLDGEKLMKNGCYSSK